MHKGRSNPLQRFAFESILILLSVSLSLIVLFLLSFQPALHEGVF